MKNTALVFLIVAMVGLGGCSEQRIGSSSDLKLIFDGEPHIFDPSVVYMETAVGRIISREQGHGITRIFIALDDQSENLRKTNLTGVVKNGRLHLSELGGYGDPLPPDGCLSGFLNTASYRWFRFKYIINNITMAADRRAQRLLARSGLAG